MNVTIDVIESVSVVEDWFGITRNVDDGIGDV